MNGDNGKGQASDGSAEQAPRTIKGCLDKLREMVPTLHQEKDAKPLEIIKKTNDYIKFLRKRNSDVEQDIHTLRQKNNWMESKITSNENVLNTPTVIEIKDDDDEDNLIPIKKEVKIESKEFDDKGEEFIEESELMDVPSREVKQETESNDSSDSESSHPHIHPKKAKVTDK